VWNNGRPTEFAFWQQIAAHGSKIDRVWTGADSRFVATVAVDGFKIWDAHELKLLWTDENIHPAWVSDDLRFAAEPCGRFFEIRWEYTFQAPADPKAAVEPYLKGLVKARRAFTNVIGKQRAWAREDTEAVTRDLMKSGCGLLAVDTVDPIIKDPYSYLGLGKLT
jgi:hypothetical protein